MVRLEISASAQEVDRLKEAGKYNFRERKMDLSNIMQQAKVMQEKMAKIQEDLAKKTITGSAGGGMVLVTVNGQGDVLSIAIEKTVIDPQEAAMLQDLIVAATNDAIRKAKELSKQELGQLTGGLNIPGLTNFMQP